MKSIFLFGGKRQTLEEVISFAMQREEATYRLYLELGHKKRLKTVYDERVLTEM